MCCRHRMSHVENEKTNLHTLKKERKNKRLCICTDTTIIQNEIEDV